MTNQIIFSRDTATVEQLCEHLDECDDSFIPPLSSRVKIPVYANKLHTETIRFEAWGRQALVGLVASYQNDPNNRHAFISNVSVLTAWRGRGIAGALLDQCIEEATRAHFSVLVLEVSLSQSAAVSLYEQRGFKELSATGGVCKMHRPLGCRINE